MEILKDSSAKDVVAVMKHGCMEQLIPKRIWINWKNQLERNDKINVSLISPLAFYKFRRYIN